MTAFPSLKSLDRAKLTVKLRACSGLFVQFRLMAIIEGMNVEGVRWNSVSMGAVEVAGNLKTKPRIQQPLYSCSLHMG